MCFPNLSYILLSPSINVKYPKRNSLVSLCALNLYSNKDLSVETHKLFISQCSGRIKQRLLIENRTQTQFERQSVLNAFFFSTVEIHSDTCKDFSHTKKRQILYLYNLKLIREDLCFSNLAQNKDT